MLSTGLLQPSSLPGGHRWEQQREAGNSLWYAALHLPAPQEGFARAQQLPDCVVTCIRQVLAIQLILHSKQALLQHDGWLMIREQNGVDWPHAAL